MRARDSAAALARRCRMDVRIDDGLIEMDVGEMEHLTHAELREKHAPFLREWMSPGAADARMPGGETLREVQERAWGAIERMRERAYDGAVVAVTHNFVILMTVCRALGLPAAEFRRLKAGIAGVSIIDITDAGCSVVTLNDRSHLAAAGLLVR
jgi:probable phosphoglycerate mutase